MQSIQTARLFVYLFMQQCLSVLGGRTAIEPLKGFVEGTHVFEAGRSGDSGNVRTRVLGHELNGLFQPIQGVVLPKCHADGLLEITAKVIGGIIEEFSNGSKGELVGVVQGQEGVDFFEELAFVGVFY